MFYAAVTAAGKTPQIIMRNIVPAVCVVMAAAALPQVAGAQISDFSFFEEALAPHGEWLQVDRYGPVWKPDVEEGWAPYTVGNWAYTDSGWTWISHEPFGSIVFHYGRWLLTDVGWCWVPGSDWGPAWVSWRVSGEHIGWAPLPPEAVWHAKHGIGHWVDVHTEIGPAYYRFCGVRDFCAPAVSGVLFRPSRNVQIMLESHNVTNIVDNGRGVFCGGPQYRWVRDAGGMDVPVLRLVREENVRSYQGLQVGGEYGAAMGFVFGDMLVLPGPRRVELGESYRNRRAQPVAVSFSKGWYGDTPSNERLRSHYEREWEARQAGQSRGMAAIGGRSPEVRIQAVTSQEKQAAFAEVKNRGIAPGPNVFVPGLAENHARRPTQGRPPTPQVVSKVPAPDAPGSSAGGAAGLVFDRRPMRPVPSGTPSTGADRGFSSGSLPSSNAQPFTRPLPSPQLPSPSPSVQRPSGIQQTPAGDAGVATGVPQTSPIKKRTTPSPQTQAVPSIAGAPAASAGTPRQPVGAPSQIAPQTAPQPQSGLTQRGVVGGASVPSTQRRPVSQTQVPVQQAPASGTSYSVTPAPSPSPSPATRTPVQPSGVVSRSVPQTQPFSQGAQPAPVGIAGAPAPRPSVPSAAPASSGAALSTVPASPAQGQLPVKKKKPGEPGYVPPTQ
jgi:hypothetical protein